MPSFGHLVLGPHPKDYPALFEPWLDRRNGDNRYVYSEPLLDYAQRNGLALTSDGLLDILRKYAHLDGSIAVVKHSTVPESEHLDDLYHAGIKHIVTVDQAGRFVGVERLRLDHSHMSEWNLTTYGEALKVFDRTFGYVSSYVEEGPSPLTLSDSFCFAAQKQDVDFRWLNNECPFVDSWVQHHLERYDTFHAHMQGRSFMTFAELPEAGTPELVSRALLGWHSDPTVMRLRTLEILPKADFRMSRDDYESVYRRAAWMSDTYSINGEFIDGRDHGPLGITTTDNREYRPWVEQVQAAIDSLPPEAYIGIVELTF